MHELPEEMEGAASGSESSYFQEWDTLYLQKANPPGDLSDFQSLWRAAATVASARGDRCGHRVPQRAATQLVVEVSRYEVRAEF